MSPAKSRMVQPHSKLVTATQGAGIDRSLTTIWVGTFASAVSTTLTATLTSASGTAQAIRSSTVIGFILVEDIGPA
jgi:hypothetical protein